MTDQYEWHHVEREDLNEGWIWIWNATDEKLKKRVENRRPTLLLDISGNKICCETLYADDRFLLNRRHPILIGPIAQVAGKKFKVRDQSVDATHARLKGGTEANLTKGQEVFVLGKERKTEDGEVQALSVTFGFKRNLIFLSAWYRFLLGIGKQSVGHSNPVRIRFPKWWGQAMWWQLRACARHPQIAVVMSTVLAVVGTGLGIIGAAAILETVLKDKGWLSWIWLPTASIGGIVFLLAFAPLYSRARNYLRDE